MTSSKAILEIFLKEMPSPRCELIYETPFQLLVAVILSAQSTDRQVNICMKPLIEKGLSCEMLSLMTESECLEHIRSIGLAKTKAKHIVKTAGLIMANHDGVVPKLRAELEALPGVGRKTASVILGELWNEPTLAVDTHVFRVGKRLRWHQETNPLKAEKALLTVIPKQYLPKAHHWLVLHGRYVCRARQPKCGECVVRDHCPSQQNNFPS